MRHSGSWAFVLATSLLLALAPAVSARATAPGTLDRGFGTNGSIVTDRLTAVHGVTPDVGGHVLVDGYAKITRWTPRGRLDRRFGTRGTVTLFQGEHVFDVRRTRTGGLDVALKIYFDTGFPLRFARLGPAGQADRARWVTTDDTVDGFVRRPGGGGFAWRRTAVQALGSDGRLAPAFANRGTLDACRGLGDRRCAIRQVLALPGGGAIVMTVRVGEAYLVERITPSGRVDPRFRRFELPISETFDVQLVRAPRGRVLVRLRDATDRRPHLVQLGADGRRIRSLAAGGADDTVADIAVDGRGNLWALRTDETGRRISVAAFTPRGRVRRRFGTGGVAVITTATGDRRYAGADLALDRRGGLLVGASRLEITTDCDREDICDQPLGARVWRLYR